MADAEHARILKGGVAAWNKWREDKKLLDPDLSGAKLLGWNLSGANLISANLIAAELISANLSGANLSGANLGGANLTGANASGANLSGANLISAKLSANLSAANLIAANLVDANLSRANLNRADLISANLSGANASGASLSGAKLSRANLSGTDLTGANLSSADLSGANLIAASLIDANLSRANLSRADLISANLSRANLSRANLDNTSFSEACLDRTIFAFESLKTARGLDMCIHRGPSAIDYDTLMCSGKLPEVFLRGCGLPDDLVRYLLLESKQKDQFHSCFISFSHADESFARRLHGALQRRGVRCWLDEHQVPAGDKIHHAVDESVRLWDKVLLCCSKESLNSWWLDKQVEQALLKEERLSKERHKEVRAIIPLNLDGHIFMPDWQDWKQQHLTSRMAPDFTNWDKDDEKFEKQLEQVFKALRADASTRKSVPRPNP